LLVERKARCSGLD